MMLAALTAKVVDRGTSGCGIQASKHLISLRVQHFPGSGGTPASTLTFRRFQLRGLMHHFLAHLTKVPTPISRESSRIVAISRELSSLSAPTSRDVGHGIYAARNLSVCVCSRVPLGGFKGESKGKSHKLARAHAQLKQCGARPCLWPLWAYLNGLASKVVCGPNRPSRSELSHVSCGAKPQRGGY